MKSAAAAEVSVASPDEGAQPLAAANGLAAESAGRPVRAGRNSRMSLALIVLAVIALIVAFYFVRAFFARVNAAVLFIALLFFGWLWGIAGLLLGALLVAIAKVICDRVDSLKPAGELLGR